MNYPAEVISKAKELRIQGFMHSEIKQNLDLRCSKSTLSYWLKGVEVSLNGIERLKSKYTNSTEISQKKAVLANKVIRTRYLEGITQKNFPVSLKIKDVDVAKIALSMLCLGEASKYRGGRSPFVFGNTNPVIIQTFLFLLKKCFNFELSKVRGRIMCRADQPQDELLDYWSSLTGIPRTQFYRTYVDARTIGKPTLKLGYKGVLAVQYNDTNVQLELEDLARLVYNKLLI